MVVAVGHEQHDVCPTAVSDVDLSVWEDRVGGRRRTRPDKAGRGRLSMGKLSPTEDMPSGLGSCPREKAPPCNLQVAYSPSGDGAGSRLACLDRAPPDVFLPGFPVNSARLALSEWMDGSRSSALLGPLSVMSQVWLFLRRNRSQRPGKSSDPRACKSSAVQSNGAPPTPHPGIPRRCAAATPRLATVLMPPR